MIYASKLGNLAFTVFIIVIVCIAVAFSLVYFLYGKYKKENIKTGNEDDDIKKDLKRKLYQKGDPKDKKKKEKDQPEPEEVQPTLGNYTIVDGRKVYEATFADVDLSEDLKKKKKKDSMDSVPRVPYSERLVIYQKKKKKKNTVMNIIFLVFCAIMLGIMIFGIVFKASNQKFLFGKSTVLTIQSNSMETVYPTNTYIDENHLNDSKNRIEKYALIGLDKVANPDQLHEYDIVSYSDSNKNTIVHRIVKIEKKTEIALKPDGKPDIGADGVEKTKNVYYYTLRGDANGGSMPQEVNLPFEKIEGKYNGFKSVGLGVALCCLQSNIGIIAMVAAITFIVAYNICETSIDKSYTLREVDVAKKMDERPWEN